MGNGCDRGGCSRALLLPASALGSYQPPLAVAGQAGTGTGGERACVFAAVLTTGIQGETLHSTPSSLGIAHPVFAIAIQMPIYVSELYKNTFDWLWNADAAQRFDEAKSKFNAHQEANTQQTTRGKVSSQRSTTEKNCIILRNSVVAGNS
eukprot:COSAG02_NODE_270_length_26392_cov_29.151980_8_plen_150_part_00